MPTYSQQTHVTKGVIGEREVEHVHAIAAGPMGSPFGNTFYVDSGHTNAGDTARHGDSRKFPFATIDYAIGQCTESQGDIILVAPGHTETVTAAGGINCDKDGIKIVGIGWGSMRPAITFTTATTADFRIDGADVWIENLRFVCGVDSQETMIEILGSTSDNARGAHIVNCEFEGTASYQALDFIRVSGSENNDCDDAIIKDCVFTSLTAGANQAIELGPTYLHDNVQIVGCRAIGYFANACIYNITGKTFTNLSIRNNILTNLTASASHAIELVSACTGEISYNVVNAYNAAAGTVTAIDPGACHCCENCGVDHTADVSGLLNPAVDS